MKLKVGSKVRVKSLEWYNNNQYVGLVTFEKGPCFSKPMSEYCGKEATIKRINGKAYVLDIAKFFFAEDSVEPVVQDISLNVLEGCTLEANSITLQDGQTAKISVENGKTKIMIEHKEEEPKFKKGDVVFLETQGDGKIYQHILIIKKMGEDNSVYFSNDFCINNNELYHEHESMWFSKEDIKSIRYATEEEKRTLFQAMLKQGMFWDENKMKVRTLKDGDIITTEECYGHTWYSIFEEIKDERVYTYSDLNDSGDLYHEFSPFADINDILSISYSTTEERQTLFDKIEEQEHQKWNAETKSFEDFKWIAKNGQKYWYVSEYLKVESCLQHGSVMDTDLGEVNNKFKTKELAEAAVVKIKELLSKL